MFPKYIVYITYDDSDTVIYEYDDIDDAMERFNEFADYGCCDVSLYRRFTHRYNNL